MRAAPRIVVAPRSSASKARATRKASGMRLDLDRVGEHHAHQRLVDQRALEGAAVAGVVDRLAGARRIARRADEVRRISWIMPSAARMPRPRR
jgi:hypothetical protein